MPVHDALAIRRYIVDEITWESASVYTLNLSPEKPEDRITFLAGQWVYWHLLNQDGSSWGRAAFSVASAPGEFDEEFQLGVKVQGDFTKKGGQLQPGDVIGIQGPFGVFTLPKQADHLVFFAGGIGVTPFRSMIREHRLQGGTTPITLFYCNRYIEDAVYFEEFELLAKEWELFTFVPTLTGGDNPSIWKGEIGRINLPMIQKSVPDLHRALYLMCGPNAFMDSLKEILEKEGVDVKAKLKKELFG
jgi:ferredoxin-NADP reductase